MQNKITGEENAFAAIAFNSEGQINIERDGLTIRQHFAAMAMQGILSSCDIDNNPFINPVDCAVQSVKYSDALIAELNKETTT